jgi:hypothetical protein
MTKQYAVYLEESYSYSIVKAVDPQMALKAAIDDSVLSFKGKDSIRAEIFELVPVYKATILEPVILGGGDIEDVKRC